MVMVVMGFIPLENVGHLTTSSLGMTYLGGFYLWEWLGMLIQITNAINPMRGFYSQHRFYHDKLYYGLKW